MKQVTKTICKEQDLLELVYQLKQEDYYKNSKNILLQIYTSKPETEYISHMLSVLEKEMQKAQIAGLTTCAEISNGMKQSDTCVLNFCFFESSEIIVQEYDCENLTLEEVAKDIQNKIENTVHIAGIQIFGTSLKFALDSFIDMLDIRNEQFQIFGAGAGTLDNGRNNIFVFGKNIYANGIIVVIYHGRDLEIKVDYNLGWTPIGKEMEITETSGNLCITTIDNMPAISIYKKYLNVEPNDFFTQNVMEFPLMMKRNGLMFTRTPIGCDQQGNIYLAADIYKGEKIRFGYGKTKTILDEVVRSSEKMYCFEAQALFLFVCENREVFLKETEEQEIEFYKNINSSTSGCYAFAEIMKSQRGGGVLNSALIAVGMKEKDIFNNKISAEKPEKIHNEDVIPLTTRLVSFLEAITNDLEESNKQLEKMATVDELTKVNNRRRIEQTLRYELSKRSAVGNLSLIMFDIDDFKKINDVYGHDIGDIVLKGLPETIQSVIRKQDSLGRWGGEEFLCILPDTNQSEAIDLAERIKKAVSERNYEKVGNITISLGVATVMENDTLESIYERVDKALYDAKNAGKNQVKKR